MIWVAKDITSFITRLQNTGHAHKHTCSVHFCSLASRLSHSRTEEHKKKLQEVGLWGRQEEALRGWLVRKTGRSFEKLACEEDKLQEVGLWKRQEEALRGRLVRSTRSLSDVQVCHQRHCSTLDLLLIFLCSPIQTITITPPPNNALANKHYGIKHSGTVTNSTWTWEEVTHLKII